MTVDETPLNPAQQEVLDLLGATAEDRPSFAPTLKATLRADLEDAKAAGRVHKAPDQPRCPHVC